MDRAIAPVAAKLWLTTVAHKPEGGLVSHPCRLSNGEELLAPPVLGSTRLTNGSLRCAEDVAAVNASASKRWAARDVVEAWLWDPAESTHKAGSGGTEGDLGVFRRFASDSQTPQPEQGAPPPAAVERPHAELIEQVAAWLNDPRHLSDKNHTDRWERVLLPCSRPSPMRR